MNLKINWWSGRLGNNILQVTNCLSIALYYNYNVIIPKHPYFTKDYIVINPEITKKSKPITDQHNFYYQTKIKNIDMKVFETNKKRVVQLVRTIFKIDGSNLEPFPNKTVVIHIRSGDIFGPRPHNGYIMPPLSYYIKILEENKFSEIYLVAEDRKNPCINELLKLYPHIKFKLQSLEKDLLILLRAQNIITSFGTMLPMLLIFSVYIQKVFKVSFDLKNSLLDWVDYQVFELQDYHSKIFPWKNTKQQQEIMLNYQFKEEKTSPEETKIKEIKTIWYDYIEEKLIPLVGEKPEGNMFSEHLSIAKSPLLYEKQNNIIRFLLSFEGSKILEIGFNAGYSSLLMKLSKNNVDITCVDINKHFYTEKCYQQIRNDYKGIDLILADSKKFLPLLIKKKEKYDLIHIDADRTLKGAWLDLENCLQLSTPGTIIIFDDTNLDYLNSLCNNYIKKGIIKECSFQTEKGSKYQHRFLEVL